VYVGRNIEHELATGAHAVQRVETPWFPLLCELRVFFRFLKKPDILQALLVFFAVTLQLYAPNQATDKTEYDFATRLLWLEALSSSLWLVDFLNMGFPRCNGGAVINTYMLKEIPMSRSTFRARIYALKPLCGYSPQFLFAASHC